MKRRVSRSTLKRLLERQEDAFILRACRVNDWNLTETARYLEMARSRLYQLLNEHPVLHRAWKAKRGTSTEKHSRDGGAVPGRRAQRK